MTYKLLVRPEAEVDIAEIISWYEGQAKGLSDKFMSQFEDCLHNILDTPNGYAKVHHEIRRAILRKFPYCIFYVLTDETVSILACSHARRDPRRWQSRI
jgi:plasmid stabilization system protein ParE